MTEQDIVKFKNPLSEEEKDALMVVLEIRDDRVVVSDLRFAEWAIPPTDVYALNDLEFVYESAGNKAKDIKTV